MAGVVAAAEAAAHRAVSGGLDTEAGCSAEAAAVWAMAAAVAAEAGTVLPASHQCERMSSVHLHRLRSECCGGGSR